MTADPVSALPLLRDQPDEPSVRRLATTSTLADQLALALSASPHATAADDRRTATFASILADARAVSSRWSPVADGAGPAMVVMHSRNDLEFVAEFVGALFAGRIPVLYLDESARPEIGMFGYEPTPDGRWVDRDTVLVLTSGGTTGAPKLVPRTNADYLLNIWLTARNAELSGHDRVLIPIPVAHNYGLGCPGVLGAILFGAGFALSASSSFGEVTAAARAHGATVVPLVPAHVRSWYGRTDGCALSMRLVQVGGSVVTARDVRELKALFDCQVQTSFGMAEGLLCQSAPEDSDVLRESATGRVLSRDDEFRIIDPDSTGLGRLEVRGPYTIGRYLGGASVNAGRFTGDGWFVTGDFARAAGERRFTVHGRADDVINRGGELIDPAAVEALARTHPAVAEAVAVAQPHAVLGALSTVFVTRNADVSGDEILRQLLAQWNSSPALPDRVVCVQEIPLTAVGKADRAELLRKYGMPCATTSPSSPTESSSATPGSSTRTTELSATAVNSGTI